MPFEAIFFEKVITSQVGAQARNQIDALHQQFNMAKIPIVKPELKILVFQSSFF